MDQKLEGYKWSQGDWKQHVTKVKKTADILILASNLLSCLYTKEDSSLPSVPDFSISLTACEMAHVQAQVWHMLTLPRNKDAGGDYLELEPKPPAEQWLTKPVLVLSG